MEKTLKNPGNIMEKPWKTLEKLKNPGIQWKNYGKNLNKLWKKIENHGQLLEKLWKKT